MPDARAATIRFVMETGMEHTIRATADILFLLKDYSQALGYYKLLKNDLNETIRTAGAGVS